MVPGAKQQDQDDIAQPAESNQRLNQGAPQFYDYYNQKVPADSPAPVRFAERGNRFDAEISEQRWPGEYVAGPEVPPVESAKR